MGTISGYRSGRMVMGKNRTLKSVLEAIAGKDGLIGTSELIDLLIRNQSFTNEEAKAAVVNAMQSGYIRFGENLRLHAAESVRRVRVSQRNVA